MSAIMIQGCTSWAGKSWLTTAVCRWLAREGFRVAPFKAQNMANNARVVAGGEIGSAQWLQALAARVRPDVRMNPVLVKPVPGGSHVVRLGQPAHELSRRRWAERPVAVWPVIERSLAELMESFDVVVIEGAGSPAEINLAEADVVNMRVAERAGAPVLLVVDIDRGGAFAHLYGTWALLPGRHQERIAGFVLNRFRGDPRLLSPGPEQLERLTGVPTVGVVPMMRHDLPDEDGAALHRPPPAGRAVVPILRYPSASNLDEFTLLEQVAEVRWAGRPADLADADLIVLPGSRHVAADLAWLRRTGLDTAIREAASAWTRTLGICGGFQMLGRGLDDPTGVVDGCAEGLNLVPVSTTFGAEKVLGHRRLRLPAGFGRDWTGLAGRDVEGYEIRHGRSVVEGPVDACVTTAEGDVSLVAHGNIVGWYLHGLLEDPDVLHALVGARPRRDLEHTFERLADAVDEHLDTELIRRLVQR